MNIAPAIYFLLVFTVLTTTLQFKIEERARTILPDRVQHSITQLAMAQYRYISDTAVSSGNYAADIATLQSGDHLPIWQDETPPRYTMGVAPGLEISYRADSAAEAGRIAARLGAVAAVNGATVTVGFADPLDLALLDLFLPLDGSEEMTGTLNFAAALFDPATGAATGNAINLNGNDLSGAGSVNAEGITVNVTGPGVGTIITENIQSRTGTFDDILINP